MVAMQWQPEGKRKVGRPKTTWRRTVEKKKNQGKDPIYPIRFDTRRPIFKEQCKINEKCYIFGSYTLIKSQCYKTPNAYRAMP